MKGKHNYREKCIGSLLGTAVGDILGAGVEGYSREEILNTYREVRHFLHSGREFGCYTDDTEMTVALAQSILACGGVDAEHCAGAYAGFYTPWRGYGAGAHAALNALAQGVDYKETGYLMFKSGSFGNGGAMRIAPVGLVYCNKNDAELKKAVYDAVMCTHLHPEGIDGALVQAKAVALLTNIENPAGFKPDAFLDTLYNISASSAMKMKIMYLRDMLNKDISDEQAINYLGNGIRAVEAVSCALLALVRYYPEPEEAVVKSVNFGGDTDTIGAMTGAQIGALHGKDWIPKRWLDDMENEDYGKDYIIKLASDLSAIIQT